jgi:hypothetical protein
VWLRCETRLQEKVVNIDLLPDRVAVGEVERDGHLVRRRDERAAKIELPAIGRDQNNPIRSRTKHRARD